MGNGAELVGLEEPTDADGSGACCEPCSGACSGACCGACCGPCCRLCCAPCSLCCPRCCAFPRCCARALCALPRALLRCGPARCALLALVVLGALLLIAAAAMLLWLRHDVRCLGGVEHAAAEWSSAWEENAIAFYVDRGDGEPGTVVYDYGKLLLSYRPQLRSVCFVTRVDPHDVPGLDRAVEEFREREAAMGTPTAAVEPSELGGTARILCSAVPVRWV